MDHRIEICSFSGAKIYPVKGIRFIRSDSQVFLFANFKCKRYFHNHLKPSKLTWTAMYRKQHKKDIHAKQVKKRRRTTNKPYSRSIVDASLEVIQKKRTEKTEVRAAAPKAALKDQKDLIREASCRICLKSFITSINALSEPIDVYSEWIDECERVNNSG